MLQKGLKCLCIVFVCVGILLSIMNFIPNAHATVNWGTITDLGYENPDSHLWLYDTFYCLYSPSNCCIVMEV
jgi:hypothetical protein